MLRLRGGAKKRKKKNYTTPKKNKHKKKKVKLAVLKYYKVNQSIQLMEFVNVIVDLVCHSLEVYLILQRLLLRGQGVGVFANNLRKAGVPMLAYE